MNNQQIRIKSFITESSARIASAYLESQGIETYIEKDDCGGNYPQLQVSCGIHLLVNAEDEQEAVNLLNDLESDEASNQKIPIKKANATAIYFLIFFLFGLAAGYFLASTINNFRIKENAVFTTDTNGDNKPDLFSYYKKDILLRTEADRNYDGQIDVWYHYKDNIISNAESDDNFDSKIDGWAKYENDNNYEWKIDTDFNGTPDAVIYFVNQLKSRVDWYPNESSILEKREIYEHGNKQEELIDTDRDGKFDLKILFDSFGNEIQRINLNP
jgi:hypothetical protein